MTLSKEILSRFAKDYGLPIQPVESEHFLKSLKFLSESAPEFEKIGTQLQWLQDAVSNLGSESAFLDYSKNLIDRVIAKVRETNEYKFLCESALTTKHVSLQKIEVYSMANVGHTFISIDLKSANFNSLRWFSAKMFDGYETFSDYLKEFTDLKYFQESKYLRQVVFGHLEPKKQVVIQKNLMISISELISKEFDIAIGDIKSVGTDELVILVDPNDAGEFVRSIESKIAYSNKSLAEIIKVEAFTLASINGRKMFVKEYLDGSKEFKAIPHNVFLQAFKRYYGLEINQADLMFEHDGHLAYYSEAII